MSEILQLTRDYEVSVWTLQDSFITVLGAASAKYRGRIQNPEMKLVNDGTLEFTFSIPMYLDDGVNRIKNPIWTDVYNTSAIMGMRKIKVIFNKGTDVEKVFEFLITKVTKTHENDKPQCDVYCEGLAFHELGKIGYKIEFSTDVLAEENYLWYINGQEGEEPVPTIDYWNLKKLGLELYPQNGIVDANKWYYKVEMDWSSYDLIAGERATNKIYEEEYTIAWDSNLLPKNANSIIMYKEKLRILDEKDSNIYNLTLRLAEIFEVFCRYEYKYDDNYHIISRTVVYYNTGIKDKERKLSFTYPYSSTKVSREDDSVDIVTKMYVSTIEDSSTDSGLISITSSEANPTREDYLLNFDYFKGINAITDDLYNAIATFEKAVRKLNDDMLPLLNELLVKEDRLPRVLALATIASNAKGLDTERMNNANRLKEALTNSDGVIVVDGMNAKTAYLQEDSENGTYYFNVPKDGILVETIKVYKSMKRNTNKEIELQELISNIGVPKYDEFNNLISMHLIPKSVLSEQDFKLVYITFSYSPKLYYDRIEETWRTRLAKDEADYERYHDEEEELQSLIDNLKDELEDLRNLKRELIKQFERTMGPALREGYWTPDNYNTNTGEKFTDYMTMVRTSLTQRNTLYVMATGSSGHTSLVWDTEKFEDEQDNYYELGINLTKVYYPCIKLTPTQFEYVKTQLINDDLSNPIGILYYDYPSSLKNPLELRYFRNLVIGASVLLGFVYISGTIEPVLLLTGVNGFTNEELTHLLSASSKARIGYLSTVVESGVITTAANPAPINSNDPYEIIATGNNKQWIVLSNNTPMVYPRCKINSLSLKNNETDLNVSYDGHLLHEFEDYYVFLRVDSAIDTNYYITFKPEVFFKYGYDHLVAIHFVLSNASTAVYLDAREILKENSKPKVTYSIDPSVFYLDFLYTDYDALNSIAFINDHELEFEWVQGYISSVELHLDFPGEDVIEVKNYKNKFEDLFSTIVALTLAMEKNEGIITSVGKVISADGSILGSALKGALKKVDLNYAFNNGKLTISEKDGIWGISDDGVVVFRGGGIFTATQKDANGNWIWNTGIVPQGINANLITAGLLDTNKVLVYAGDRLRFQLNGDGLFAYKSFLSDFITTSGNNGYNSMMNNRTDDIDYGQYVVMNENGLFLNANRGSYILNDTATDYIALPQDVTRVELSWSGLKMRNWDNQITFFASASTGDLFLSGTLNANKVYVQESDADWNRALHGSYSLAAWYLKMFEDHVKVSENLTNIFNKASEILTAARESLTAVNAINMTNYSILSTFFTDMSTKYTPVETTAASHPWNFKTGDIWNIPATSNAPATRWIATSNWDEVYNSENAAKANSALTSTAGWTKVYNGAFAAITGATMKVDAEAGSIYLGAGNDITIESGGTLDIGASSSLNLTSNGAINLNGSGLITLASTSGIKLLNSGKTVNIFNLDSNGITIGSGGKIKIESDLGIDIVSASNTSASVIQINRTTGILLGSSKKLSFSSSTSGTTGANVEIDPTRIIFGVSATGNTSFFEMKSDYIIAGTGANKSSLESGNNPSSSLAGLKITNSGIWLATQSGNTTNLISMDNNGIKLGSVPASGNEGSFVSIAKEKILIGSTAQLYINAANVELNTTYNGTGAAFRLGSTSDPELLFADGTLKVKGEITATSFILASGATVSGLNYDLITGAPDPSEFEVDGISTATWNNQKYVALTSGKNSDLNGLLLGVNDGKHIIVASSASQAAVDISTGGINFDYSTSNYIHINNDGIAVQGNRISINGDDVWARDDIVVMSSDSNHWSYTIAGAESHMSGATNDWVLIKPYYAAEISQVVGALYDGGPSTAFGFGGHFSPTLSFATVSGIKYKYKMTCTIATSDSFLNTSANDEYICCLYLSDTAMTSLANAKEKYKVRIKLTPSRFFTNAPLDIENDSGEITTNLYTDGATIYWWLALGGSSNNCSCTISNLKIIGQCPSAARRIPCTVYYYPKSSS